MRRRVALLVVVSALVLPASLVPRSRHDELRFRVEAAQFPKQVTLNMQTRAGGDYTFPAVTVPTGVVGLMFSMDISEASGSLPLISASLEGSLDGGNTWMPAGAFTRAAGPKGLNKQGVTVSTTGASFFGGPFWNDAANANRRLRGSATIGGTLRFALEVMPL
jgi:hypothetical protein